MKKSKAKREIERMIHRGYKLGVCDINGNSVTLPDGSIIAKPRGRGVVRFHKVYRRVK